MLPARAGVRPRIERNVVVLPAPFGPSSATTSPAPTDERHAEERLRLAVERLDARRLRASPALRRGSSARTHGFSRSSAGVPSAMTCPQWITEIRSASPNRNFMSCSITTIVRARFNSAMRPASRAVPSLPRPGRGLVEKEEPRLRGERHRDLERTPFAVGQALRRRPLLAGEADAREHGRRLVLRRRVGAEIAPAVEPAPADLGQRDQHVVERRVVVEQIHDLERARNPAPRDLRAAPGR